MTKIIAFSGRKQSGKSTGAEYVQHLLNNKGLKNKVYSFADPLKQDICINMLGLTYDQCYGSDDDKNSLTDILWENIPGYLGNITGPMTAREVMEVIGTNIFRKIKNDVWVQATLVAIQRDNLDIAIIADCRFPNEVNSILKNNGFVIRITKDPFESKSDAEMALDPNNYDWSKFSTVINNQNINIADKNQLIEQFLYQNGILN
jgi:hypothetical protein